MNLNVALTLFSMGLLVAAAACGGGASPSPGAPVGEVIQIRDRLASVNATEAHSGMSLVALDRVITNANGSVDIKLVDKFQDCRLWTSTTIAVHPRDTVLLGWIAGTTWCATTSTGEIAVVVVEFPDPDDPNNPDVPKERLEVRMSDPVFGITVGPDGSVVRVAQGIVAVRSLETAGDVVRIVGPDQQTFVAPGADPGLVESFVPEVLPEFDGLDLGGMVAAAPAPELGRPDPAGSVTLGRIFEQGELVMGIDEGGLGEGRAAEFLESFGSFWSMAWDVRLTTSVTPLDVATKALDAGAVDVVVTPAPTDGSSLPFFVDDQTRLWRLVIDQQDTAFATALTAFLQAAVGSGRYGEIYEQVFATTPPLDDLAAIAGL